MKTKVVYLVDEMCAYMTKESAFKSICANDDYTTCTQSINTPDGIEEIKVNEKNFYTGIPIYVHIKAHKENYGGFDVDVEEMDIEYTIHEVKLYCK